MQTPPVYSFLSPTLLENIEEVYRDEDGPSRSFIPGSAPIETCMGETVTQAERAIRTRHNGSVIQIWDASRPENPVHYDRPLPDAVHRAYQCLQATDRYFRAVHDRPPINDGRELIRSFLYHPQAYNNSFWNPATGSIYSGDVDTRIFTSFIDNQEITTHEFGHAVTDGSSSLLYQGQSGALNESVSDVFAIIQKHMQNNTQQPGSPEASWLIGEGVIVNEDGPNLSLRSMSAPGTAYAGHKFLGSDDQRGHMSNYLTTDQDYGGIHANAGIPNRAFQIAATTYGEAIWKKIGKVWHDTLVDSKPNDDFAAFAQRSFGKADGLDRYLGESVRKGWYDVGVDLRITGHKRTNSEE